MRARIVTRYRTIGVLELYAEREEREVEKRLSLFEQSVWDRFFEHARVSGHHVLYRWPVVYELTESQGAQSLVGAFKALIIDTGVE